MKTFAGLLFVCVLFGASACAEKQGLVGQGTFDDKLFLVKDGRPVSAIVIPDKPGKWTLTAARWLQEYVQKAGGAELTVSPESRAPAGVLISIGHTKLAENAGIDVRDLKYDGCKLIVKGNTLYLIGRDDVGEVRGSPYIGARGTCRAVVTFLEDFCGVRWFLPGPMGELVPRARDIAVPLNLKKTFIPAFVSSSARYPYGRGTPASIANNFRVAIKGSYGGHTYYRMLPTKVYFKDHPEYFALINGKRTGKGNHLCSSNPEVKKILLAALRKQFDKGYDMATFGQEDGYLRCQCPECERLDNYRGWGPNATDRQLGVDEGDKGAWKAFYDRLRENPCERVHLLNKYVIDGVKKSHPGKLVNILTYGPTMYPSKSVEYGDNVVAEICSADPRVADAWKGKVAWLTGYFYWFDLTLPMGADVHASPREVAEGLRTLREKGFRGISQYAETNWGLQGPSFYVFGRLLGDPGRDYTAIVKEYCDGVFGKAGKTMLEFYDRLYDAHDVWPLNKGHYGKLPPDRSMSASDMYLALYTPELLKTLGGLLEKAESEAVSKRSKGWLQLVRDHFDFARLLTEMIRSYRAYVEDRSEENRLALKNRVDAFNKYRMRIITYPDEYTGVWFPGHDTFCNYITSGAGGEKIYYTPWKSRKAAVLRKGLAGVGMGYNCGYNTRTITMPLTMDFSKEK